MTGRCTSSPGDGRWRLIEVKSSASSEGTPSRRRRRSNIAWCLALGWMLVPCCLAHVNRNFVFRGGNIDPRRFFRIRNLTRRVQRLQPKLTFQLRSRVHSSLHAASTGHRSGSPLHRSRHVRVLRPLQSAAPGRSHRVPATDSTRARWRSWRSWASSPSTTSLTISN